MSDGASEDNSRQMKAEKLEDNVGEDPLTAGVMCEAAEETATTDSEEYLSEPLRYRNLNYSSLSNNPNITLLAQNLRLNEENDNFSVTNSEVSNISNMSMVQVPIVGYEIMEERARFTVYKLRIETRTTNDCWYVFRRYTDFVRLCNRLRNRYPDVVKHLPRKRWLKNNFDPMFLEERVCGLQTLVNAILNVPELLNSQEIQEFFCLNEPPVYSDTNEESRAMLEALEETINDLKQQVRGRDATIEAIKEELHRKILETENLKRILRNSTMNCQKCSKECENFTKLLN